MLTVKNCASNPDWMQSIEHNRAYWRAVFWAGDFDISLHDLQNYQWQLIRSISCVITFSWRGILNLCNFQFDVIDINKIIYVHYLKWYVVQFISSVCEIFWSLLSAISLFVSSTFWLRINGLSNDFVNLWTVIKSLRTCRSHSFNSRDFRDCTCIKSHS